MDIFSSTLFMLSFPWRMGLVFFFPNRYFSFSLFVIWSISVLLGFMRHFKWHSLNFIICDTKLLTNPFLSMYMELSTFHTSGFLITGTCMGYNNDSVKVRASFNWNFTGMWISAIMSAKTLPSCGFQTIMSAKTSSTCGFQTIMSPQTSQIVVLTAIF